MLTNITLTYQKIYFIHKVIDLSNYLRNMTVTEQVQQNDNDSKR